MEDGLRPISRMNPFDDLSSRDRTVCEQAHDRRREMRSDQLGPG
jgi:hypothetical protein